MVRIATAVFIVVAFVLLLVPGKVSDTSDSLQPTPTIEYDEFVCCPLIYRDAGPVPTARPTPAPPTPTPTRRPTPAPP